MLWMQVASALQGLYVSMRITSMWYLSFLSCAELLELVLLIDDPKRTDIYNILLLIEGIFLKNVMEKC